VGSQVGRRIKVASRRRVPGLLIGGLLIGGLLIAGLLAPAAQAAETKDGDKLRALLEGGVPQNVEDLRLLERRIQEIARKVSPATVGVRVGGAQGSGVIIDKEGHVLTAAHVVGKPGRTATFVFPDGSTVTGKTLGAYRTIDAGLMKITSDKKKSWPYVEMGKSTDLKQGQWCLATGHPGGFQRGRTPVLRLGRILAHDKSKIITDCTLVGGDSGGPLFDLDGRVIGIHSRIGGVITANVHVPVDGYRDDWDRLAKGEEWGALPGHNRGPFLGVVADRTADEAKISEVFPGSPAAKAGLKPGDIVTRFDGKAVEKFTDLALAVSKKKPGDKVEVAVRRGDETLKLMVTIGRRGS